MRTLSTLLVLSILMLAPLKSIQTTACAQGWAWGRGTVTGSGQDTWAVTTDPSGNVYGGGITLGTGAMDFGAGVTIPSVSSGGYIAMWVKYGPAGTPLWAGYAYCSSTTYMYNMTTDAAGNLYVFGSFYGGSLHIGSFTLPIRGSGANYYLAKISPSGTVIWAVNDGSSVISFGYTGGVSILGAGGVTVDPTGNVYIASSFEGASMNIGSTTLTNAGLSTTYDAFVAKYSPAGIPLWAKSIGGTGNDEAFGVAVVPSGEVYITGGFYSPRMIVGSSLLTNPTTYSYAFLAKFSPAGTPLWGEGEGGTGGAFGVGIEADNYGNVYMCGGFVDPTITFGSTTITRAVSSSALALYLVRYTHDAVSWSKSISSTAQIFGFSIAMASCGQIWVSGNYRAPANIDGHILALVPGNDPVFIAGYDLAGGVVGYAGLASGADDQNGIACDGSGNVFVCSDFYPSITYPTFPIGPDTLTSGGGVESFYVAKYANTLAPPDTTSDHKDTTVCGVTGEIGITLKGRSGYTNYYWNDSSTDSTLYITRAGTYYVYNINCGASTLIDTFHVTFIPPVDSTHAGHDTSVCGALGDSLYAPLGYSSYIWSTGSIDTSIFVSVSGYYILRAMSGTPSSGCHLLVDSFHVAFLPPADTTYKHTNVDTCAAIGFITLHGDSGYRSYSWSTGSSDSMLLATSAGTYIVQEVSAACDLVIDTFHFTIAPNDTTFNSKDTSVCSSVVSSFILNAPSGYATYLWNTGSTSRGIFVSTTATFRVIATQGCSVLSDTFHVSFLTRPTVNIGNDTAFCIGNSLVLTNSSSTGVYLWSDGSTGPSITVSASGTYWLNVISAGVCTNTDTIHVLVSPIPVVNLGPDVITCPGVPAVLASTITYPTGTTYLWSTGATTSSISTSIAGRYWLQVTNGGCPNTDTIVVNYRYDTTYAHENDSVCVLTGSRSLTGPAGYTGYLWNTGATTSSITASVAGTYYVYATVACNMQIDTFHFSITPTDTTFMTNSNAVCISVGTVTLSSPAGYSSYVWSTGGTGSSTTEPAFAGTGNYGLIAYNGCHILSDKFSVRYMPVPVVNLGNDTAFCIGNTLTLSSPQPAGFGYSWSTGSTAPTIDVSASGTYTLTVTDSDFCTTASVISVTVSPIPVVDLGPDTAICTGSFPLLQSRIAYPPGATYLWSTGSTAPSVTATSIGTYWLQVTVVGCPGSDTLVVKNLFDTLNFTQTDTSLCLGQQLPVVVSGTPGMTYQWTPTTGISSSTTASTVILTDTSATYTLTASISTCPPIVKSFHLDIQPYPQVYISDNRFVCRYDTLHLEASVTPSWYTHYSYNWSPGGDLDDSTIQNAVYTAGDSGKIVLTVSTPHNCIGKDSIIIHVHPSDSAVLNLTVHVCPHDSVRLMPISKDPGTIYRWHPGLYLSDSMAASPWVYPITSQHYVGIAYSQYNCRDTVHAYVEVDASAEIYLGSALTTIYPGESYQIPTQTNCTSFAWFPPSGLNSASISAPIATPQISTKYIVNASTEWGCKITDSIEIDVSTETLLAVPNAFTPGNGSGPNNTFKLDKRGIAKLNYFRIYNRWGNKVYESTDIDAGWDGTYKGVAQSYDVYVYQVEAVTSAGRTFSKSGNVTLIR